MQVRATEVVRSDLYRTGVTLRFPRVERMRYDKLCHQALTTTELKQLVQVCVYVCVFERRRRRRRKNSNQNHT